LPSRWYPEQPRRSFSYPSLWWSDVGDRVLSSCPCTVSQAITCTCNQTWNTLISFVIYNKQIQSFVAMTNQISFLTVWIRTGWVFFSSVVTTSRVKIIFIFDFKEVRQHLKFSSKSDVISNMRHFFTSIRFSLTVFLSTF
jgi:hypothetical protein